MIENNNGFLQIDGDKDILSNFLNEQQLNNDEEQAENNQYEFQSTVYSYIFNYVLDQFSLNLSFKDVCWKSWGF